MDKTNILIIEETREDALFLENALEQEGYKVWLVRSRKEALNLIHSIFFPLVVSELYFSDGDAIKLTQELLKINPTVSIVVVTAVSFISSAVKAMEKGAYGYIIKPFNPNEVKIVIRRAWERYQFLCQASEQEKLIKLSIQEGLTKVYNRRFFDVYLNYKFSNPNPSPFSLIMIDIDFFKKYNDTYGHIAGDRLLQEAAAVFKKSIREKDLIFRYGGEEFTIILEDVDKKAAQIVAQRLQNLLRLHLPVTVSMGISSFPEDAKNAEELISKADQALYKAKESGRDRICLA